MSTTSAMRANPRDTTVSVVIPAYQAAETIGRAVASLAAQTRRDFEAIVVDDGSSDGTAAAAQAALDQHGIDGQVVRRPRGGPGVFNNPGAARNAGIAEARGTFVAFLDADDRWEPRKLELSLAALEERPQLAGVCHAEVVRRDGEEIARNRYGTRLPLYWSLLLRDNCMSTSATVVRRDALLAAGCFTEAPEHASVEDYDLWLKLARNGGRFAFIDEPLGEYQRHAAAISLNVDRHLDAALTVIDLSFERQFGPRMSTWQRLLHRQRRMRPIRQAARSVAASGDRERARRLVRRAAGEWPLSPKLWAVAALIALRRC
jgi:teichuronic acid biosynthesis glycosyltransferase TuaG